MKTSFSAVVSLLLAFGSYSAHSATLNWTNTASGGWNTAANWNPNAVPGPGDTAIITNAGVTVSLNSGTTVGGIILGTNGAGTVTLSLAGQTLVVNGPLTVNPSGSFTVDSGALSGSATISGVVNWTGGTFGGGNYGMTIAANGTVILAGTNGGTYILSTAVTNSGIMRVQSGNLQISYCGGGQFGRFVNLPGALVDMTADVSIGIDGCSPGFLNQGLLRKSGGTGTNNISGPFITTGTVEAQTGVISLNGNDSGSGLFTAATGATVMFSTGTFTFTGNMTSSNAVLAGAILSGNSTISGVLTWTSGTFGTGNNAFTIATNAMLILAGTNGGAYILSESVTNAGIVRLQSGNLQIVYCGGGQFGKFVNLPGALVDMTTDVSIGIDGCGPGFVNQGLVRKSGGTGTNNISGPFITTGTVEAQTGAISLNGSDSGSGLFTAATGATVMFSTGTFTLAGNMTSSNAVLAGATLLGNGTINGVLTWTSGIFGTGNNVLTIATNAMLILAGTNGGNYVLSESVTNAGIIRVQSGNLQIDFCGGGQFGKFINLPGALVDMTGDVGIAHDGCGTGIINEGTVRKSGGTGTNNITGVFVNTGTVDAQTGTISFNGTDSGGGIFNAAAGATLAFSGGTFTLTGNMTSSNAVLAGATLLGNGTISGVLTWTSGIFGSGNNVLTIATNALLVLAGTNGGTYLISQAVTNAGIVRVQSGNLQIDFCGGGQYGRFVNLPGALVDMPTDVSIGTDTCGPGINNQGTVRKSGGTGTNNIAGVFVNTGTVDAQTGTISFNGTDSGGGLFAAEPGATLAFSSGTFTLTGNMTSSNAILAGATLSGNGTINGVLNWTSGIFGTGNNALTIASNALLVLAGTNGGNYLMAQAVTNAGTVRVQSGNLQIDFCGGGQYGRFVNLPGALVDMTGNVSIGTDTCGPGIINMGTVRKSGGTGTNTISGVFANSGTIDVQKGNIALQGAYTLANGTKMSFGLGGPAGNGSISLSGAASFAGSLSVNLNNSFVPDAGSLFNLLNYTSESGVLFTNTVLPAGIIWQTNYYPTAFVLAVINTAQPALLISTLNGTNVLLQWPADHTGWRLQAQTNPITVGLYTNWATVSGSGVTNQIFMPIGKTNGAVFFRLIYP